jgi:4'-phosphopantetheinyl transferase
MASKPNLVQWMLDTRPWFPEATQTKHLETHVGYLSALTVTQEY